MRLWENKNVYIVLISNIITIELELWFAIIANIKRALDFSSTLMSNLLRKRIGCNIRFALSLNYRNSIRFRSDKAIFFAVMVISIVFIEMSIELVCNEKI